MFANLWIFHIIEQVEFKFFAVWFEAFQLWQIGYALPLWDPYCAEIHAYHLKVGVFQMTAFRYVTTFLLRVYRDEGGRCIISFSLMAAPFGAHFVSPLAGLLEGLELIWVIRPIVLFRPEHVAEVHILYWLLIEKLWLFITTIMINLRFFQIQWYPPVLSWQVPRVVTHIVFAALVAEREAPILRLPLFVPGYLLRSICASALWVIAEFDVVRE